MGSKLTYPLWVYAVRRRGWSVCPELLTNLYAKQKGIEVVSDERSA